MINILACIIMYIGIVSVNYFDWKLKNVLKIVNSIEMIFFIVIL